MNKVLLLTNTYEFNSFITDVRAIKLIVKGKAEPISYWNEVIKTPSNEFKSPATIRLLHSIKRMIFSKNSFNRNALIRRDKSTCQYCSKPLSYKEISIDHIIPKSYGGTTSYTNCVVSCKLCNSIKRDRTPEQANMKLINSPENPKVHLLYLEDKYWHKEWEYYIK